MEEFFKALKQLKKSEKRHTVTIAGTVIEVSLDKKLEIQRNGEDSYMLQEGKIIRKPIEKNRNRQSELHKSKPGMVFLNHNPYWPISEGEEGYEWSR